MSHISTAPPRLDIREAIWPDPLKSSKKTRHDRLRNGPVLKLQPP